MKNFLAIYRGEPKSSGNDWDKLAPEKQKEQIAKGMEAWGNWMKEHSSQIIENGGPLGKTLTVSKKGISSITNKDCGYVIIQASSHEEAARMFLNHPHFSIFPGENVEIMECLAIPQIEE